MQRREPDYLTVIFKNGIRLFLAGFVIGIILFMMNLVFSSGKYTASPLVTEQAHASIFHRKKKKTVVRHQMKITTHSQIATVKQVYLDGTLRVQGPKTKSKQVQLFLLNLPPKNSYQGKSARCELKKLLLHKKVYIATDRQANKSTEVYVQRGSHLIQEKMLRKGLAVMYNYNGSEQYYKQLKAAQDDAKADLRGVWKADGYVTDTGFNPKAVEAVKQK